MNESTAFVTEWALEPAAGTAGGPPAGPVLAVVGFDGSEPAQRALDAAAELLRDRDGELEVVYVAGDPATSAQVAHDVGARLEPTRPRWHFQRRDGAVAGELMAAAEELRQQRGSEATIVLVVGGSSGQRRHRAAGPVSVNLARADQFPLLVVP